MITEDIKIPTDGKPIEAFTMSGGKRPERAFLILPGKGYTINHFVLDFLWRMAAESGFFAIKAEYRGYTYRHLGEPYDHEHAAADAGYVFDYLTARGYSPDNIVVCAKSLGTLSLASLVKKREARFQKVILLTPILYLNKGAKPFPGWALYNEKVKDTYLVFGGNDPYCDEVTARQVFPDAKIQCYGGADHGLHLADDYARTIEIQHEIITGVRKFITE